MTSDETWMAEALAVSLEARTRTAPNPWVGCALVPAGDDPVVLGATEPPGGAHAEVVALRLAGESARGATAYVTLEPCCHHGRTPPCTEALIQAGVTRVVIGTLDPDPLVAGKGAARLRAAGAEVTVGVGAAEVEVVLAPYLTHRRTGRPYVVLKLAATLDGRIAAPDGSSRWITGPEARADVHRLRAESGAIVVGAGTVRADDPALTVRDADGRDPLRLVLGPVDPGARVQPAESVSGELPDLLDDLGQR
ncbi:MAG: bifunctional diaminohydroxyphosphoribosylaminopyrimidine deaminase/5-amino-6-(5-phosphoribosylamino)uracil reductase RibD [Actinomycetes bacterium]